MASIVTDKVEQKRRELLAALRESVKSSGLTRDSAEAQLSSFFADAWNDAEVFARQLSACGDTSAKLSARQ